MKLIRMKIHRTKKEGATHYEYPPNYIAEKVVFGPIYEGGLTEVVQSDVLPRNADDEFILIGVADVDFSQFMRDDGYEKDGFMHTVEEVDKVKALEMGNKWTKQTEKIIDERKVIGILAKVARQEVLTQEEKNAIDPDKEERGINKTPAFSASLDNFLKI